MPKNPYLINNNKPVEEVREIPTYQPKYTDEEVAKLKEIFLAEQKEAIKKYQIKGSPLSPEARSKVIRKWGSDYVSEDREGYGPCSRCSVRTDCNCEYGEKWNYLKVGCPAKGCPNEDEVSEWMHDIPGCGYRVQLSNRARIRCTKHGCSIYHMRNWDFLCSHDWHKGKHSPTSSLSFKNALIIAGDERAMDEDLIDDLTKFLRKPENKWYC